MTALTPAAFAAEDTALIAGLVAGTISPTDFSAQRNTLYATYGVSNAALYQQMTTYIATVTQRDAQVANYFAGTPTGGVSQDGTGVGGYYPITDGAGYTRYFPCPAYLESIGEGGTISGALTASNASAFSPSATGTTLTLPFTPPVGSLLDLYVGGVWQLQGVDYTLAGDVVTFTGEGVSTADSIKVRTLSLA